jgi:hypothetical protein
LGFSQSHPSARKRVTSFPFPAASCGKRISGSVYFPHVDLGHFFALGQEEQPLFFTGALTHDPSGVQQLLSLRHFDPQAQEVPEHFSQAAQSAVVPPQHCREVTGRTFNFPASSR